MLGLLKFCMLDITFLLKIARYSLYDGEVRRFGARHLGCSILKSLKLHAWKLNYYASSTNFNFDAIISDLRYVSQVLKVLDLINLMSLLYRGILE